MSDNELSQRQLKVEKVVTAPVDLVFEVWTKPEHLKEWWGPNGYTTTIDSMTFEEGGEWIYEMKHEEHGFFPNFISYVEIQKNKKIVYDHGAHKGEAFMFQSVVTFEELGDQTKVTLTLTFPTKEACDEAKKYGEKGGQETLGKMENYIKSRL
jgi:uncharacterized protein YndB with AHSA1/START domain